jgi:hypothetical protein
MVADRMATKPEFVYRTRDPTVSQILSFDDFHYPRLIPRCARAKSNALIIPDTHQ